MLALLMVFFLFIRLIPIKSLGRIHESLLLSRHIHVVPYTLLLLTIASGAYHFCRPLYIPVEIRLWPHPLTRGRSLSRYTPHKVCLSNDLV
jgi:hypothetical protein